VRVGVGDALERLWRIEVDAGVKALGENNSIGERRAEPGRDREAILGVETVLVEAPESQPVSPFSLARAEMTWAEVVRWEEPHHPGPLASTWGPR
jgi:hypothetical protein